MAKRKGVNILLVSSQKGLDFLQPIVISVFADFKENIQLDLYAQSSRNTILNNVPNERNFIKTIKSCDLILVDLTYISPSTYFNIGIARAVGKPVIFIAEEAFIDDLPDFVRQNFVLIFHNKEELKIRINEFLTEYLQNPKRFTPTSIIDTETSSKIIVDLEKLDLRDFENLCFELLARLGYKNLEWRMKDKFLDAVTTLKKQDPDGYEYDEFWLISFDKEFMKNELLNLALHDPEYFIERIYRNVIDSDNLGRASIRYERVDVPITLLIILKGKDNYSKKYIRKISKRDFKMSRGFPFTIRIRLWDDQMITSLTRWVKLCDLNFDIICVPFKYKFVNVLNQC